MSIKLILFQKVKFNKFIMIMIMSIKLILFQKVKCKKDFLYN